MLLRSSRWKITPTNGEGRARATELRRATMTQDEAFLLKERPSHLAALKNRRATAAREL